MSRAGTPDLLGDEYLVVAARVAPDGAPVNVIKYEKSKRAPLYLYFRRHELVQWGDVSVLKMMPEPSEP